MNKSAKLVLITMFKNESKSIRRMLESTVGYVDYYIFQNNGSEDGTQEIAESFLKEHDFPGFVYLLEEGWKGFGWNRDHLIQVAQKTDHGCDWIFSIDCDEVLVVDSNFDWHILNDKNIHSFEVTAEFYGNLYQRARLYNAKFPWRFNHDLAHETIYMDIPEVKENFNRYDLDYGFRQIGYPEGQSWESPNKFLFDALNFEQKLIKENSMVTDMYHFWYIGKSYFDAFPSNYPLGLDHKEEFARRSIFYFLEYLKIIHEFDTNIKAKFSDEKSYYTLVLIAEAYYFLKDKENTLKHLYLAEQFCQERNDHLIALVDYYEKEKNYEKMLEITEKLIDPSRTNPFPRLNFVINKNHYYNTGTLVQELNQKAKDYVKENAMYNSAINIDTKKRFFVVDNFYTDPYKIREYALGVNFSADLRFYKGIRSNEQHIFQGTKEIFESIIGEKINHFHEHEMCGRFQVCTSEDPIVYHNDNQKWAAMIYLSPDAPFSSGTKLLAHKETKARSFEDKGYEKAFSGGFYDATKFETVDEIGNVFNRLVIFNSKCIHSASQYFGTDKYSGRLTHLFFFD